MAGTLTERDIEVVLSVYKYRYLTTSHVARLHFPSRRTAQRRLTSLTREKLIAPFTVPNMAESIYRITKQGAHLVASVLGVDPESLTWRPGSKPPKDYYFMRHFAAVSDFRITLTRAAAAHPTIKHLGFIPEHYGAKHLSGRVTKYVKDVVFDVRSPGERITHAPDGVFALKRGEKATLFFLEIDRGTESISNPEKGIGKMIRFYESYASEGTFRGYAEDFRCPAFDIFVLLLVTTSARRVENIRQSLGQNPPPAYRFFWLATLDDVSETALFSPIWKTLDAGSDRLYSIG